ncbi:hypothetical protein [Trabulsiella odontotermitis]|uniref:Uncharacterized protein n=1 Tax=Trabulsiella odontotermitis TaxID=379893 RepID=A0A0L0GY68_9ENTR|nr:hypothetical protein [Trabulsiella odontotermitis]KNC93641.1 hypothetical protein GM31_18850 [Trabulsiella odontotermitis]
MTHAIKQIVDTDGEPMMEVVVNSYCSAVDMDAIHAEALEINLFEDRIAAAGKLMFKHGEESAIEACHAEALEMNETLDAEFASIDELAPDDNAKAIFKAIASKYEVGCMMGVNAAHAEALKMNTSYA